MSFVEFVVGIAAFVLGGMWYVICKQRIEIENLKNQLKEVKDE